MDKTAIVLSKKEIDTILEALHKKETICADDMTLIDKLNLAKKEVEQFNQSLLDFIWEK